MKYIFLIIIFYSFHSFAQQTKTGSAKKDTIFIKHNKDYNDGKPNYVTDTFIYNSRMTEHYLTGTSILPFTHNSQEAYWIYGFTLKNISKTDCQKSAEEYEANGGIIENKINSIENTDSTLTVDINIFDNCCYDFLCDISIKDSSILDLNFTGYGTYCTCDCCYGMTYYLTKNKKYDLQKIKEVMINGDRKTLKKIKFK